MAATAVCPRRILSKGDRYTPDPIMQGRSDRSRRYALAEHILSKVTRQREVDARSGVEVARWGTGELRKEFAALAATWRRETEFVSSSEEKVLHPAYQSIMAMGRDAVPLVLEELKARRGHWFWALKFMTRGSDPVPPGANIEGARQAWLEWGKANGYLR